MSPSEQKALEVELSLGEHRMLTFTVTEEQAYYLFRLAQDVLRLRPALLPKVARVELTEALRSVLGSDRIHFQPLLADTLCTFQKTLHDDPPNPLAGHPPAHLLQPAGQPVELGEGSRPIPA